MPWNAAESIVLDPYEPLSARNLRKSRMRGPAERKRAGTSGKRTGHFFQSSCHQCLAAGANRTSSKYTSAERTSAKRDSAD
jgi:hypothetical protein